jgi:transposase
VSKSTRFIGLDDSKNSIEVAVAEAGRDGEIRRFGSIENSPTALRKLVRSLGRPKTLHFAYEAGPGGYGIYRELLALGANCIVAAPTKTPRRTGDQVKNDRRDAVTLARLHRAGELVPVWVPDGESEAMRDLTRSREDAKYAQTKARQRVQSFLLRHGRRYSGRSPWARMHLRWLSAQRFDHPSQQICFEEYVGAVEETTNRVQRLDQQIQQLIPEWSQAVVVRALTAHRGVSDLTAASSSLNLAT